MYFIQSAATISHQPTFQNRGFSSALEELPAGSGIVQGDYKKYVQSALLRRMSKILRMAVACSADCMEQAGIGNPGAVIVGTGLGCLEETEKFLNNIITLSGGMLPPTSFIQSTHNTVAGQISLNLQNHNYNMTHTQNTLSFEHALGDAFLCLEEGKEDVLVGAADEHIPALDEITGRLGLKNLLLTSGASFFVLSEKKNEKSMARIEASAGYALCKSFSEKAAGFFAENNIHKSDIDLLLYCSHQENFIKELSETFPGKPLLNYEKYSGTYFTNPAFALHLATDILQTGKPFMNREIKRILICNNLNDSSLGLTLAAKIEA